MLHSINTDNSKNRIALVDCNNFYVSCERVFNPKWQKIPVGVLSNNDGCIIARSNELKDAGIKMGVPYFKYKDILKKINAIVVSSNYTLYGDMSSRVMNILSEHTPSIEIYSIDEAWLDLSGFNPSNIDSYGRKIAYRIKKNTGIPVSIGIAETKTLAKIANRVCKKYKIPGSVFNIGDSKYIDNILKSFDVKDIWGIGPNWSKRLKEQGILTALDLKNSNPSEIRNKYNVVMQRIVYELNGKQCLDLEEIAPKKEIVASRSFGKRVTEERYLIEAVSYHTTRAAEKLRAQNSVCSSINISIKTGKFSSHEKYFSKSVMLHFPTPTNDTRLLTKYAKIGIRRIFEKKRYYAKAGIMLTNITSEEDIQMNLFEKKINEKSQKLMKVIDNINKTHGNKSIHFAAEGIKKKWMMKQNNVTKSYTTNWNQLPIAIAN